tara:strand:+ start:374 stop:730 length:357 start_codon:yes stop_codon:yes gene_type:complete
MTCLEDTYYYLCEVANKEDYTIIHSIVERRSDRLRHPHAVVYNKKTGNILEVSNAYRDNIIEMPFMLWIRLGNVSNIIQYSLGEYVEKMLEAEKYEFWDLQKRGVIPPLYFEKLKEEC